MKNEIEISADLTVSVNDNEEMTLTNVNNNHLALRIPDWKSVVDSPFRSQVSIDQVNKMLWQYKLLMTIYIADEKVITLGSGYRIGVKKLKLAYRYIKYKFFNIKK